MRSFRLRQLLLVCCLGIGAVYCFGKLLSDGKRESTNGKLNDRSEMLWDHGSSADKELPLAEGQANTNDLLLRLLREGQEILGNTENKGRNGIPSYCPGYTHYSEQKHLPLSSGPLKLPFQRPTDKCRTFHSDEVEKVIENYKKKLNDPDLARLFENCFPNTLDTTISWHNPKGNDGLPESFIVTGDIDAEWLRDSYRQLRPYQHLVSQDKKLKDLILGAILTQADYVTMFPYCNAFQPPRHSDIWSRDLARFAQKDNVYPPYNSEVVFECKYELDSLASFLGLSNEYYNHTGGDTTFLTPKWFKALSSLLRVLNEQSQPTYAKDGTGSSVQTHYRFQRDTNLGTETLNLAGQGNPVNANTSLIRSAFRPSDDATIYQFFIPANAQMAMELERISAVLEAAGHSSVAKKVLNYSQSLKAAIWNHGVYKHPVFGDVFAYEVDGYGGISNMDDANLPSLLSLPEMGFVTNDDPVYLNTRKMILSKSGNPYYLNGRHFSGIGGPHVGTQNAWPMSHLVAIRTSNDKKEIADLLALIKISTSGLGLMHETINVDNLSQFTRPWFAWANSEFANTIFDIAERFPDLIFKQ